MTSLNSIGPFTAKQATERPTIAAALRRLADAALRPARRRAAYRDTADQLRALNPRLLKDVFGIEPWQIEPFASRTVVGELEPEGESLADALRGFMHACLARRTRKADIRALMSLDERMLRDIGLSRAEIVPVVYGYTQPWNDAGDGRWTPAAASDDASEPSAGQARSKVAVLRPVESRPSRAIANDHRLPKAS